jgi:DNA-binding LacI/PurR family transcriptional regulator
MAAKLKDVARLASVSPSTVSLVLNQRASQIQISEATRQRVFQAAIDLNYSPNRAARALRMQKTYTIGIVSFDTNDPMANAYAAAIDRRLSPSGYRTIVTDAQHDANRAWEHIKYFLATHADGIILLASSYVPDAASLAKAQADHNIPFVCALRDLSPAGIHSVVVDYRSGAHAAARHLIEVGCRRIAVIVGSPVYNPDPIERLEGVRQACERAGIQISSELIVYENNGGWNPSVGYRSMQQLLAGRPLPDAVSAFDDVTAYGAIRAIYEAGLRVPEEIAVVGFDDLAVSAFYNPPLTTVRQPVEEISTEVCEYLLRAIENQAIQEPACKVFVPQLILRKSTQSARENVYSDLSA